VNAAGKLTVSTPTDRDIVLSRAFDAPRHLVFAALTRPELLKRWYGARGWHLVGCEVDLRVGGAWRFVSRGPDGAEMGQGGVYQVIEPPVRLVYTELFDNQSYPGESLISHELVERAVPTATVPTVTVPTVTVPTVTVLTVTVLTTTIRYATREGRDTVLRYPMARGVGESYDRLAAVLVDLSLEEMTDELDA
jgi:uncharacterized protein YndB with AHSA1/START domain